MKLNKRPGKWASKLSEKELVNEINYIKGAIKTARKYYSGFEASKGWNLRNVTRIPIKEIEKVKAIRREFAQMEAETHVLIRPRSKSAREALVSYTRQSPRQKAYLVMKAPEAKVKLVKGKTIKKKVVRVKGKRRVKSVSVDYTKIKVERSVTGGVIDDTVYLFSDFTKVKRIYKFEQIERALKRMMPHLPDGEYVFVTKKHDNIVSHASRDKLIDHFENIFYTYKGVVRGAKDNTGIFEDLIGVRLTGFTQDDAEREYVQRITRRRRMQLNRNALRAKKARRVSERIRKRMK